jgi:hypothetical protein
MTWMKINERCCWAYRIRLGLGRDWITMDMLLLRVHSEGARKAICSAKNNEGIFETVQEAIEHAAKN